MVDTVFDIQTGRNYLLFSLNIGVLVFGNGNRILFFIGTEVEIAHRDDVLLSAHQVEHLAYLEDGTTVTKVSHVDLVGLSVNGDVRFDDRDLFALAVQEIGFGVFNRVAREQCNAERACYRGRTVIGVHVQAVCEISHHVDVAACNASGVAFLQSKDVGRFGADERDLVFEILLAGIIVSLLDVIGEDVDGIGALFSGWAWVRCKYCRSDQGDHAHA